MTLWENACARVSHFGRLHHWTEFTWNLSCSLCFQRLLWPRLIFFYWYMTRPDEAVTLLRHQRRFVCGSGVVYVLRDVREIRSLCGIYRVRRCERVCYRQQAETDRTRRPRLLTSTQSVERNRYDLRMKSDLTLCVITDEPSKLDLRRMVCK